jgi:hypothetical protein
MAIEHGEGMMVGHRGPQILKRTLRSIRFKF